ncbi:hypothetical protein CORC01_08449 [Colletotrichum orchidophilum]|uniref:Uncharacterized protein n=1 Tax=Colletotrichum orchidophilum TaxID=1209926 RepID=A0A1G4B488_9PEZI|nr:hypothetical protein CORC01_08449 [Colletotrichum orchidophilum]
MKLIKRFSPSIIASKTGISRAGV